MINFIYWLFDSFMRVIDAISFTSTNIISGIMANNAYYDDVIGGIDFNLVLFSDTPILTTNVYDALLLFFGIFYTVIFVVIVYKIIKKVFVKITGWNKW